MSIKSNYFTILGRRAIWLKSTAIYSLTELKVSGGISGSTKWPGFEDSFKRWWSVVGPTGFTFMEKIWSMTETDDSGSVMWPLVLKALKWPQILVQIFALPLTYMLYDLGHIIQPLRPSISSVNGRNNYTEVLLQRLNKIKIYIYMYIQHLAHLVLNKRKQLI